MKKLLLAALALAALATACRKDDDVVTGAPAGPPSLAALTKQFAPPVQVFTFDAARAQTLLTAGGATLTLAANSFVRPDGTAPTGPVRLQFQEIYDPAAMLLADMPTQTNQGRLLESGGEFCLRAYEGTTRLQLGVQANNLEMTSPVPPRLSPARRDSMTLWTWTPGGVRQGDAGWQAATDTLIGCFYTINITTGDTTITCLATIGVPIPMVQGPAPAAPPQYSTRVFPDTLGWLNCDVYLPTPTSATVYVTPDVLAAEQRVYLIPHDRNGAFRPYYDAAQQRFQLGNIPAGTDLTAVVIQVRDGKYYIGTQRAPAANGFVYRPTLEALSEEELVRRIRLL